jgi:hypothetical protein
VRTERGTSSTRTRENRGQERRNTREIESPSVRDNGSSRNNVPSYTPPTVRTPSTPPPAVSGNRTPSSTGNRSGNTRTGRR